MCGRFAITTPVEAMRQVFQTINPPPNYPARYNVAPTQDVLAVRHNPASGERSLDCLRWGLIPHWAKDAKMAASMINARAESLADKPAFRDAFARRRCLIPADAFYEWQQGAKPKQPYAIRLAGGGLFAFAGLWENWRQPDGNWLRSCSIVTTAADSALAHLHHRAPVILDPADYATWLTAPATELPSLRSLLRPFPSDRLELFPVGTAVNLVANDDPSLLRPMLRDD